MFKPHLKHLHALRKLGAAPDPLLQVCKCPILTVPSNVAGIVIALHPCAAVQAVLVADILAHTLNVCRILLLPAFARFSNKHIYFLLAAYPRFVVYRDCTMIELPPSMNRSNLYGARSKDKVGELEIPLLIHDPFSDKHRQWHCRRTFLLFALALFLNSSRSQVQIHRLLADI